MITPTPKQLEIRDEDALNLLVVAPAGCGKTEALALRIQGLLSRECVVPPKKILVLTFSNRARDNIKERLSSYLSTQLMRDRVTITNFHGLAARLFRAHGNVLGLDKDLNLPENDWVRDQLRRQSIPWEDHSNIQRLLQEIKQQPLDDDAVENELKRRGNSTALKLEQLRKQEAQLTYDDLPRLAELILQNKLVADLYSTHFSAIIVDEFQDLTLQQLRIVKSIGHKRTTFAGDIAQGIYSFAGANPMEVDRLVRSECSAIIQFSESHRSSPAVLNTVNALNKLTGGQLLSSADPDSWPSSGLSASIQHKTATSEAKWIVKVARAILSHAPEQRIGILSRTAARRRFVDEELRSTDIAHFRWEDGVLDTDTANLVKAMLSRFDQASYNKARDKTAFLRESVGFELVTDVDVRRSLTDALGWVQDLLFNGLSPDDIRARIKIGGSEMLITSAGVHLLSGHVGKGQQFDWVFVVGLEEGSIPFFKATTREELAEEARVLSVMISRAQHGVILSRANSIPTNYGHPKEHSPSRFLQLIDKSSPLDESEAIKWFREVDWKAISSR